MKRRDFLGLAGAAVLSVPKTSVAQTLSFPAAITQKKPLRVIVIANTFFEADGLMAVVCNDMARSPKLDTPRNVVWPRKSTLQGGDVVKQPRCLIDVNIQNNVPSATMEIWCLDDLMSKQVAHGDSENKARAMDIVTGYASAPDGVVAFGTAGYPNIASTDGCATIGSTIFIHDAANDGNGSHSNWSWSGHMGSLVPSKTPLSFFSSVAADQTMLNTISREMLAVSVHPAGVLQLIIAPDAVAISSVNIPVGTHFCDVDSKAIAQAKAAGAANITSVETTHGIIRAQSPDAPFIYVTAIPNRVCHFDDEASNNYGQEFAASHNAGIALNHVMTYFVSAITQ